MKTWSLPFRLNPYTIVGIILCLVLIGVLVFNKPIKEHRITKAKMELFRRMLHHPPEEWKEDIKTVVDSMVLEKHQPIVDSTQWKSLPIKKTKPTTRKVPKNKE